MEAFKIYKLDKMGYDYEISYALDYDKAIQIFNDYIRKEHKAASKFIVDKTDFAEEISMFREYNKNAELICRTYPLIMYKSDIRITALIPQWEKTSYEYDEYDICGDLIVLETIELLD